MLLSRLAGALLCGAAAGVFAPGCQAGEAPAQAPWTGFNAGVMAAASRLVTKGTTLRGDGGFGGNAFDESANINDRAGGIGIFAGYRRSFDPGFVAGAEADLMALNHRASNYDLVGVTTQPAASLQYETRLLSTARVMAGWPIGNVLVYATTGAALALEDEKRTQYRFVAGTSTAAFTETASRSRFGLALGAGAEWRVGAGWSLRAEYLHVRFADATFAFPDARGGAQGGFTTVQGRLADNTSHMNLVRIGVSYTFGTGD